MKKTLLILALGASAALACSAAAFAAPAQVIIIRHGEKPENGGELNEQGFRRAEALVWFFQTNAAVTRYGTPAAIYAAAPKNEDSSIRSIQTVTPLARALKITINTRFTRGQAHKLAADIMANPLYEGRMVLVCWQHGNISAIIRELAEYNGSGQAALNALPSEWPDGSFDRAWLLNFSDGRIVSSKDIGQRVLPGDSF